MMIDSGASVNLLDETTFQRINSSRNENHQDLLLWMSNSSSFVRNFHCNCEIQESSTPLLVVQGRNGNLLSYHTVSANIATITDRTTNKSKSLKEEFMSLFGGIGKVPNKPVKLHIDPGHPENSPIGEFPSMLEKM